MMYEKTDSDFQDLIIELTVGLREESAVLSERMKRKSQEILDLKNEMAAKMTQLETEYAKREMVVKKSGETMEKELAEINRNLNTEKDMFKKETEISKLENRKLRKDIIEKKIRLKKEYSDQKSSLERQADEWKKELKTISDVLKEEQKNRKGLGTKLLSREEELEKIKKQLSEKESKLSKIKMEREIMELESNMARNVAEMKLILKNANEGISRNRKR